MMPDEVVTDLLDTAFDVARRHKSFGSYGSQAAAVRALHRRCSFFSKEQCREALEQSLVLFDIAMKVCEDYKEVLSRWHTPEAVEAADHASSEIKRLCPDFGTATCRSALVGYFAGTTFDALAVCTKHAGIRHNES